MWNCRDELEVGLLILKHRFRESSDPRPKSNTFTREEGIGMLTSGEYVLEPRQTEPPFELLTELNARVGRRDLFGPPIDDPKVLEKVSSKVFAYGIRHSVVEGLPINWFENARELRSGAEVILSQCDGDQTNLFEQARATLKCYIRENAQTISWRGKTSEQERVENRLVRLRSRNFMRATWDYAQLREEWFDFHEQIAQLGKVLDQMLFVALPEGRIICSEEHAGGPHLLPPQHAGALIEKSFSKKGYSYCFTRDLSADWFEASDSLPARRRKARAWMESTFKHFRSEGRRASAKDLIFVAQEKFDITNHAAKGAWEEAKTKLDVKAGNIAGKKRVNISEISALK